MCLWFCLYVRVRGKKIHKFFIHFCVCFVWICVCMRVCVCVCVCVCACVYEREKQNQQLNLSLQHKNWILQMSGSSLIAVCGLSQQFFDFQNWNVFKLHSFLIVSRLSVPWWEHLHMFCSLQWTRTHGQRCILGFHFLCSAPHLSLPATLLGEIVWK